MDKSKMVDSIGRPLTQGLFLEIGYDTDAVFTLKEYDFKYKGKTYPSAKKLFVQLEDPTGYAFATKYLLGWDHWQRLLGNKQIAEHIDKWQEELEVKVKSQAIADMHSLAASESGNFSATKWLAESGWAKRSVGRPSKSEKERENRIADKVAAEFQSDLDRMRLVE